MFGFCVLIICILLHFYFFTLSIKMGISCGSSTKVAVPKILWYTITIMLISSAHAAQLQRNDTQSWFCLKHKWSCFWVYLNSSIFDFVEISQTKSSSLDTFYFQYSVLAQEWLKKCILSKVEDCFLLLYCIIVYM